MRSHLVLLLHKLPLNDDHLSTTATILGSQGCSLYTSLTEYKTTTLNCRWWRPEQMGSEPGVGAWTVWRNSHENWNNSGWRSQFRRNGEQVLLQHESDQIMAGLSLPEVNFTNILWALFTCEEPKSTERHEWLDYLFALLGSACIKAARKHIGEMDPRS